MKKIKHYAYQICFSPLALSFWIPLILLTSYFASRGMMPFGKSTILTVDLGQQYIDQFSAFKHTLLNHPSSFLYSFSNGLGADMLGEWAYYLMSPFNLLYLMVDNSNLPSMVLIVTVLKFATAGLSMAYLLKQLNCQRGYYVTVFAINYPLSGWFIANDINLLWLDTAILLPLVILTIENLLQQRAAWPYSLLLSLSIITNYYIGFMVAIFVTCYTAWRLLIMTGPRLKILGRFIWQSCLGGLLSAWLLIPTYWQLQQGKIQHNSPWSLKFDNNPLKLLFKFIPGSFDFQEMQTGQANIYVSVFVIAAFLAFLVNQSITIKAKIGALVILTLLILATTWAPLTLIFHGGQYPVWYPYRFSFIISFFMILLGAWGFNPDDAKQYRMALIFFVVVLIMTLYASFGGKHIAYLTNNNILVFWILGSLLAVQFVSPLSHYLRLGIIAVVTLLSLSVNLASTLNNFSYIEKSDYQATITALNQSMATLKNDHSWYRVGQTFQRTRGDGLMTDFYGGSYFSSLLSSQMGQFYQAIGQPEGDNYVLYSNGTLLSDAFLGFKYFLAPNQSNDTLAGSPQSRKIGYRADFNQYRLFAKTNQTNIWQNPNALSPVFAANSEALKANLNSQFPLQNQAKLWQALTPNHQAVLTTDNFDQVSADNLNIPTVLTNGQLQKQDASKPASLTLTFTPPTDDSYYLTIGGNLKIDNFDLLINNRIITQFSSYRNTVITNLTSQAKGQRQTLTIRLRDVSSLALDKVALYHLDQTTINQNAQELQDNQLHITSQSARRLSGTITTTNAKSLIMTSIPYAPGWQAQLNGHSIATKKAGNFFLAVPTKAGRHQLKLTYTPPYLVLGSLISALAGLILLWQILFTSKQLRLARSAHP